MSDENDDLASLLSSDEDDVVSYFPSTPQSEQQPNNSAAVTDNSAVLADMQRKLDEQAAELTKLKQIPTTNQPIVQQQFQQQQSFTPQVDQNTQLKQQFENMYLTDPAGAMVHMFQLAKQQAVEEARRAMIPISGQTTRFAIDQYRASANLRDDEKAEFDSLIGTLSAEDLANANPALLSRQLEILKNAAKGAALDKRQNAPQPRVPTYSVHSNIPSNSSEQVRVKLSSNQKAYYQIGLENGFTPEQIMKQIKEEGIE